MQTRPDPFTVPALGTELSWARCLLLCSVTKGSKTGAGSLHFQGLEQDFDEQRLLLSLVFAFAGWNAKLQEGNVWRSLTLLPQNSDEGHFAPEGRRASWVDIDLARFAVRGARLPAQR